VGRRFDRGKGESSEAGAEAGPFYSCRRATSRRRWRRRARPTTCRRETRSARRRC